jgi:hypothetical protein
MRSSDLKKKLAIVYALAAISVVFLVVMGIVILNGSDEDDDTPATEQTTQSGGGGGEDAGSAASLKTVAVERAEGKDATVTVASPSLKAPKAIWLRVSAAPKQEVSGSWNVSCGSGSVAMDAFTVTPPHELQLEIPRKNAPSCIAGASAQLKESGRVKLTILRDR